MLPPCLSATESNSFTDILENMNKVKKAIDDPVKILHKVRRYAGRAENRILGCDVMAEDWDNLLILDACRYDMFERLVDLPGDLQSRRSKGSATREFVTNNFAEREFFDTVYVTGNPFVSMDAGDSFHALEEVWKTHWDEEHGTVLPEDIRDETLRAVERYPNKRVVAHFMQPHHPFVGPTAMEEIGVMSGNNPARQRALGEASERSAKQKVWAQVRDGELSPETLKRAYDENLEVVVPIIEELCERLDGKTVVTSDHGNLLDESAYSVLSASPHRYAHPKYATAESLVKVPWHVYPARTRRTITSEPPTANEYDAVEQETLDERLESLGYK